MCFENSDHPTFIGIENLAYQPKTDFRLFGKPTSRPYRRMGVVLNYDTLDTPIEEVIGKAIEISKLISVNK